MHLECLHALRQLRSAERLDSQYSQPNHEEASRIMRFIRKLSSLRSLRHLGGDRILRSFSSRVEVVNDKQSSQEEIWLATNILEV